MTLSTSAENSLLRHDELSFISQTHYPILIDVDDEALVELRHRVRDLHAKEQTFVRQMRRSIRGKESARGGSFPGEVDRPSRRKQVFAGAMKRINKEATRRKAIAAREATKDASRRALALKAGASRGAVPASVTPNLGMARVESRKRRWSVSGAKVGRVSQAGKRSQARRDAR